MPPKVRVTQEAILKAGLAIIREKGIDGLNAREVARALGCSVQPVFSNFQSMENLRESLYRQADSLLSACMAKGMHRHQIPFLGMGMAYIAFAKEEGNLFKFLFMSDAFRGKSVLEMIRDEENKPVLRMIAGMTGLDMAQAERLFLSIWLTTHGIAALMATNSCDFSEELIAGLLTGSFSGMKNQLKNEGERKDA